MLAEILPRSVRPLEASPFGPGGIFIGFVANIRFDEAIVQLRLPTNQLLNIFAGSSRKRRLRIAESGIGPPYQLCLKVDELSRCAFDWKDASQVKPISVGAVRNKFGFSLIHPAKILEKIIAF